MNSIHENLKKTIVQHLDEIFSENHDRAVELGKPEPSDYALNEVSRLAMQTSEQLAQNKVPAYLSQIVQSVAQEERVSSIDVGAKVKKAFAEALSEKYPNLAYAEAAKVSVAR